MMQICGIFSVYTIKIGIFFKNTTFFTMYGCEKRGITVPANSGSKHYMMCKKGLNMGRGWVLNHDSKHTLKTTKANRQKVLQWPLQSPYARWPKNLPEL